MSAELSCDEIELELTSDAPSPEVRAHVEGCLRCQQTVKVLGLSALPPLSDEERLLLTGVPQLLEREWRRTSQRSDVVRRVVSLALAAGVGALLASGAWLSTVKPPPQGTEVAPRVKTVVVAPPEGLELDFDVAPNLSDDDVFFEVGWPSPTEGDL